ncbi:MAG: phage baseplate assembly protein V [Bacteroidales bacterium]|nr:phage baseplate assembly protein V [Bacteroidales bacterium]
MPASAYENSIFFYTITDCSLTKEFLKPSEFTFTLRRDKISKNDETYDVVRDLIGEPVIFTLVTTLDGAKTSTLRYRGTIGKVSMKGLNITCVAYSDDAKLQGPPKSRCFIGKTLKDIVETVCGNLRKQVVIHGVFNQKIFPLIVQHNESDYDFLVRLAKRFGAFFYFNNQDQLVFGKLQKPPQPKEINSPHFSGASYELLASDPNVRLIYHDYESNEDLTTSLTGFEVNAEKLFEKAKSGSEPLKQNDDYEFFLDYPDGIPVRDANTSISNFLTGYHKAILGSYSSNMAFCKFVCYLFDVDLGSFVKINANGVMLVTSEVLTWDCNGSPSNEVTAVLLPKEGASDEDIFAPYMDVNAYPKSSAQRAMVIDNVDPMKMGRVQVQFAWQADPANADEKKAIPWIRIAQPYGGNKKGCYILPEIGEEVMVGFEHENMEKPFVIGTLFHDSENAQLKQLPEDTWCEVGGDHKMNEMNEVKAFRTKKGHTIEFHDTKEGNGFIRIYGNEKKDGPNYDIVLSTDTIQKPNGDQKEDYKAKSADESVEAGKDVKENAEYKVGKLRIMVRSNGGDIMLDAGAGDIIMNAANIRVNATGNITYLIEGKNVMKAKGGQFVDVKDNSLVVQGKQDIVVKGDQTVNVDSNSLEVQKKQNIVIKGDQTVNVDSNSLEVQKKQNIVVKGTNTEEYKEEISIKADKAVKLKAQSIASETDQKTEIKASQSALIKASTGLDLQGGSKADLKATNVTVDGDAGTTVKGADLTLDGKNSISERAAKLELTSPSSISLRSTKIDLTSPDGSLAGVWKLP